MKNKITTKAFLGILAAGIIFFCIYFFTCEFGIPKPKLEDDICKSQKISDDWLIEGDISDTMAAFISYSKDKAAYNHSVYVNRPGCSFGYFFRGGGALTGRGNHVCGFTVEGYDERAFISMNELKVERLEIDNGISVQTIAIDSEKPFAIVLPVNAGEITFYDVNGNVVEYSQQPI